MAYWTLSGTTRVRQYQKGKTSLDLLEQETVASAGVTGHSMPPIQTISGLKRPGLDYIRGILWPRPIHTQGHEWPRLIHAPAGQIIPR